jgi:(R,R)-butanediol dehydrogenase / meso-butanediol dehydrogenase / diacetyl reductase
MKSVALRFHAKKDLRLDTVEIPEPGPDQVLVRVRACGICTTDRDVYLEGSLTDPRFVPVTIGHESSLEVLKVGSEVPGDKEFSPIAEGDMVTAESIEGCRRCFFCNRGLTHVCANARFPGVTSDGFDCTYQLAPWHILHRSLPGLSDEQLSLTEPAAGALHAVKRGGVKLGDTVVIFGCGPIGLLQMQICRAAGAETIVVDPVEKKRQMAKKLGADHALDPNEVDLEREVRDLTGGLGADIALEAAGLPRTYQDAIRVVRKQGRVVAMGIVTVPAVPLDLGSGRGVTINEVSVVGTVGHGLWPDAWADFRVVMKLIRSGRIEVLPLVTHRLPLTEWKEAFELPAEERIKVIFNRFE